MTPAAPTATWRKVCEEYFSRLIEDLEPQVETEVESRVTAAIDAAVRGAVSDAAEHASRVLAEELNQGVRRLREAATADELYEILLDVTILFCEQAAVFSVHEKQARAERMRRPAEVPSPENGAGSNLPPLLFPLSAAAAFLTAYDTRDPVIAAATPVEISPELARLFKHEPEERVYLFPVVVTGSVEAILYAAGDVQAPPVELLATVAGLQLKTLKAAEPAPPPVPALEPKAEPLVSIATVAPAGAAPKPLETTGERMAQPAAAKPHKEWWALSRQEQHTHLAAQRFARVLVAEIRLQRPGAIHSARADRNLYRTLKAEIDAAREKFREKHMTLSPVMVDYLHLELVRSLADDDPILLGADYPGPLV